MSISFHRKGTNESLNFYISAFHPWSVRAIFAKLLSWAWWEVWWHHHVPFFEVDVLYLADFVSCQDHQNSSCIMRCGVLDGCYEKWSPLPHVQLTGMAKKCSMCSWPIVYGGQEIMQENDLHVTAIPVVAPNEVVAPFAVVATIAFNCMVFTSGSCYQLWSGSVVT